MKKAQARNQGRNRAIAPRSFQKHCESANKLLRCDVQPQVIVIVPPSRKFQLVAALNQRTYDFAYDNLGGLFHLRPFCQDHVFQN